MGKSLKTLSLILFIIAVAVESYCVYLYFYTVLPLINNGAFSIFGLIISLPIILPMMAIVAVISIILFVLFFRLKSKLNKNSQTLNFFDYLFLIVPILSTLANFVMFFSLLII